MRYKKKITNCEAVVNVNIIFLYRDVVVTAGFWHFTNGSGTQEDINRTAVFGTTSTCTAHK